MISKEFLKNIESGDPIIVKSALVDDLIIDRTFKTFDENFSVASQKLNLLVPYDGEPFEADTEKWNIRYLNQQKVALMINFSEERIDHLKAVIAKVMPPDEPKEKDTNVLNQSVQRKRTGRTVKTEREVIRGAENTLTSNSQSSTKLTGRCVINETITDKSESSKSKSETDGIGTALIIGGAVTAVVGAAISEPVIIGAGAIAAGAGVYVKVNNQR